MIATLIGWLCLTPVLAVSTVFAVEVAMGLLPAAGRHFAPDQAARIVVIIPAHDEEAGIGATISALLPILPAAARLLVIADNCSDMTAASARSAGAEVIERHDPSRRGKGHALSHARDALMDDPPDIAIVIDADCRIGTGGIERLAAAALATGGPVQAAYLLTPRRNGSPMVQLSGFAFLVKNLIRQRGLARIGAPAILTGSGMAFPWPVFADAPLATDEIVEDLALGIALTERGQAPSFLADVTIRSNPSSRAGTFQQRRRWEHGSLGAARSYAGRLIRSGGWGPAWLGAHLLVPPLALLMSIHLSLLLGLACLFAGGSSVPFTIEAATILLLLLLVLAAWIGAGREQIKAATLLYAPLYILWKIPLYLAALIRPERQWNRTDRSEEQV